MTIGALAKELARREGKKSQARIGDIRELLGHLSDMIHDEAEDNESGPSGIAAVLLVNGIKRAKRRRKKGAGHGVLEI